MLAGFLHVAAAEKTNERVTARDAELVWTGPDEGNPRARRTFPVVIELLEFASRQVTIVGYSLFLSGSSAKALLARREAGGEGVNVEFIVDRNYAGYHGSNSAGHSVRRSRALAGKSSTPRCSLVDESRRRRFEASRKSDDRGPTRAFGYVSKSDWSRTGNQFGNWASSPRTGGSRVCRSLCWLDQSRLLRNRAVA